jgi:hypothetical protein
VPYKDISVGSSHTSIFTLGYMVSESDITNKVRL